MSVDWLMGFLAQAAEIPAAGAEGAAPAPPPPMGGAFGMLAPMLAIFAVFYFLVIRPESRKRKAREQAIRTGLKKGDTVVTTGGIIARVWRADGPEVVLIVDKDKDIKVRFARSAIFEILKDEEMSKEATAAVAQPQERATS